MEIRGSSVPDKNGSPMNVSAVITYQVHNPMAFLFNVDDAKGYIKDQGSEVLKKIMSRFDYMSNDPGVPSLLDDTMVIGKHFTCQQSDELIIREMYERVASSQM
jgi:hypothetical protein